MAGLQFPILDQDKYKGRIKFDVYETIPPDISQRSINAMRRLLGSSDNEINGNGGGNLSPRLDGKDEPFLLNSSRVRRTGNSCSIYLPQSIQISDGVSIENTNLGAFGAGIAGSIQSGSAPLEALFTETGNAINSMADFFRGNMTQDAARAAAAKASGALGEGVSGAVRSALQTTPNPNTRALFRSVNLREFSFTFNMIPKSPKEAREITNIIKFFRTELYPESIGSPVSYGYKFPNKFAISIEYDNKKIATGILKSYLRTFQTNYNPNHMSFFEDGNFQETQISLSFVEARTLDKKDIVEGGF